MEIIFITIPVTLVFIGVGAAIFFWASNKGQFDDLDSPAHRILFDDDITPAQSDTTNTDHKTDQDAVDKQTDSSKPNE